jgi:hypothetical protein
MIPRTSFASSPCFSIASWSPSGRESRFRRNKFQKITEYGLIEWSGEHQHRRYRPVGDTIAPPIDLQNLTNVPEM